MSSSILTALQAQPQPPNCQPGWPEFYRFVTTNCGDVPVLDDGKFISRKILGYWTLWCIAAFFRDHSTELEAKHFDFTLQYYLPQHPLPPERTDHIWVRQLLNFWRLIGGKIE